MPVEESQLVKISMSSIVIIAVFITMAIFFIAVFWIKHLVRKKYEQEIEPCDQQYPASSCDQSYPLNNGCVQLVQPHTTEIRLARSYQDQAFRFDRIQICKIKSLNKYASTT